MRPALAQQAAAPASPATAPTAAAPTAAPPAAVPGVPTPARLEGSWQPGHVPPKDKQPGYCFVEAQFSNRMTLVVARTQSGRINLALGMPNGVLTEGRRTAVQLRIDAGKPLEAGAFAVAKDMLILPLTQDEAWYQSLRRGHTLFILGPEDSAAFSLEGSGEALQQLTDCARTAESAGAASLPASGSGTGARLGGSDTPSPGTAGKDPGAEPLPIMRLPETLASILIAAGMANAEPIDLSHLPEAQRPADYAWRFGKVLGGVREARVPPDAEFERLTEAYVAELKARCSGSFTPTLDGVDDRGPLKIRMGRAACTPPAGSTAPELTVSLVFYLTDAGDYAFFFHEAPPAERPVAEEASRRIAGVLRAMAERSKRRASESGGAAKP